MDPQAQRSFAADLIARIVRECPRRQPTSADERRAHDIMKAEFEATGLRTSIHDFRFNDNIHANLALHFGLGTLGTVVSPFAPMTGFALHAGSAASFWADSNRRGYFLRRLFPFKPSRNLLGIVPARGEPKLRLVFVAHIDAAFTGLIFHPWLLERTHGNPPRPLRFLKRPTELAVKAQSALAGIDVLRAVFGAWTWPLIPLEALLTLPSAIMTLVNLEIMARSTVVPGANDDLSGVVSLPLLAQRLMQDKHPDVELVFVATGCEEASLGGADALARDMKAAWDPARTVVLALDQLSLGNLMYMRAEGEVTRIEAPAWLTSLTDQVAASEPRFAEVVPFEAPVGGTDAGAFLAHGYEAMALVCIDPRLGAPRHYHRPDDSPENIDPDKIVFCLDFAEKLSRAIVGQRLGASAQS